jgi:arabinose-5-phosphate isomerase
MNATIKQVALQTIQLEAQSVSELAKYINGEFEKAVNTLAGCKGRVIVSGIGKSAIVAQKIVATFNSTGTPAVFLHAADAIHGDLGMIQQEDILLILSKSGNSPEIKALLPLVKNFGNTIIGMVGEAESYMNKHADILIHAIVNKEACPYNLAPTSSATAQMVMGDALALCLMELKGFGSNDFAKFHPGGMLGKKLYLRVNDLYTHNEKPAVRPSQSLKEVIMEMTAKRLGATAVTDDKNSLLGIITDGDLRRMLEKNISIDSISAEAIMTKKPKTIGPDEMAVAALELLKQNEITQLVVTENDHYLGILHLHDLVREGLF